MTSHNKLVIVDIDGTIAKIGDRLKYLKTKPKDYDRFYKSCFDDEPIIPVIRIVHTFYDSYARVVFCTGRSDLVREQTYAWLIKYCDHWSLCPEDLLMRKSDDKRSDTIVKPELLKAEGINFKDIAFVLEDRSIMVKKWRDLGLTCLQVAEGDF